MLKRIMTIFYSAAATVAAAILMLAAPEPAHALTGINCGKVIQNVLRLENGPSAINSMAFVNLVNVNVSVPAGTSGCIKVLFTAEAACRGPAGVNDTCYIRAIDNGVEIHPQGANAQVFLSEDPTENAHAYEWVHRVRAGNHNIIIQRRVGNAGTSFLLDDWTFDVQVTQ